MATDILARGLAAASRNGSLPALARFDDLPLHTIPTAFDRLEAGTGRTSAPYISDALATAALAAAHPRFCKADAGGRYFRFAGLEVDIVHAGATGSGNDQPAIQAAVSYAAAVGIGRVTNASGIARLEMWRPAKTTGANGFSTPVVSTDGIPLCIPACARLDLDFGGAAITLRNDLGAPRFPPNLAIPDGGWGAWWLGGWCTIVGHVGRLRIANVDVDGGWTGPADMPLRSNLTDKGLATSGASAGTLILENVNLHGFASEVTYLGRDAVEAMELFTTNCHFHHGGQMALNLAGVCRGHHLNLRVGVDGDPGDGAEVIGGLGQVFVGGVFKLGGTFMAGPDPDFVGGQPYNLRVRQNDAPPPMIEFIGTRFETGSSQANPQQLYLSSFTSGSIVCVDMPVYFQDGISNVGGMSDVFLDVTSIADTVGIPNAVGVSAPSDGASKLSNFDVRICCGRTDYARANGHSVSIGVNLNLGLIDSASTRFRIAGEAMLPWTVGSVFGTGGPTAEIPLMVVDEGFIRLNGSPWLNYSADTVIPVTTDEQWLWPDTDSHTVTLDATTYIHAEGQRFIMRKGLGAIQAIATPAGVRRLADALKDRLVMVWRQGAWMEESYSDSALSAAPTTQAEAAYTAKLLDGDSLIRFTNAGAVAFTIPPNSAVPFPIGTVIEVEQAGTGIVTFTAGAGVTLQSRGDLLGTAGQHAVAFARLIDADTWTVGGDLA